MSSIQNCATNQMPAATLERAASKPPGTDVASNAADVEAGSPCAVSTVHTPPAPPGVLLAEPISGPPLPVVKGTSADIIVNTTTGGWTKAAPGSRSSMGVVGYGLMWIATIAVIVGGTAGSTNIILDSKDWLKNSISPPPAASFFPPSPAARTKVGKGAAFAGNGECAMLSYMGVFGGLAAISNKSFTVDAWLTGVTASNSGGGWFLGSVYGGLPSFPPLMGALELATTSDEVAQTINNMWFSPLLARIATIDFPGSNENATWKKLVHGLYFGHSTEANTPMSGLTSKYAQDRVWLTMMSAEVPFTTGKGGFQFNAITHQPTPGGGSMSYVAASNSHFPAFLPVYASAVMGQPNVPAPVPFCAMKSSRRDCGMNLTFARVNAPSIVLKTLPFTGVDSPQHISLLDASTGSSCASCAAMQVGLQPEIDLSPIKYAVDAPTAAAGQAYESIFCLHTLANGLSVALDGKADPELDTVALADGYIVDNNALTGILAFYSKDAEVGTVNLISLDNCVPGSAASPTPAMVRNDAFDRTLLRFFNGGTAPSREKFYFSTTKTYSPNDENAYSVWFFDTLLEIFEESPAQAYAQMANGAISVLDAPAGSAYLQHLLVGTLQVTTKANPFFGIRAGLKVNLHWICTVSTIPLAGSLFGDANSYKGAGEVAATMLANSDLIKTRVLKGMWDWTEPRA